MATYVDRGKVDTIVSCPYNPGHKLRQSRLQYHLIKCGSRGRTGQDLIECPFNATHRIPDKDFDHHLRSCPSSFGAVSDAFRQRQAADGTSDGDGEQRKVSELRLRPVGQQMANDPNPDENWDDDVSIFSASIRRDNEVRFGETSRLQE